MNYRLSIPKSMALHPPMSTKKRPKTVFSGVPGFAFSGVSAGLKADPKKRDLALIYSTASDTTAAGVFTRNLVRAAPVRICEKHVRSGKARLILINAGIANAATGVAGLKDAESVVRFTATSFELNESEVLPCSTGKIGPRLPLDKIRSGILKAKDLLHPQGFAKASQAICTTDAYPKTAFYRGKLRGKAFSIAVMAKGAGMIAPNMATMLCFIATDLNVSAAILKKLLKESVDETLNRMTVDGDTSTNDTVLMLANGLAGNPPLTKNSKDYAHIRKLLTQLLRDIAVKIVTDGEGATKCFEVRVKGAKNATHAERAARAIADSQLVKTAMFGNDPNWGRIACAAGYSGAAIAEKAMTIKLGGVPVFVRGKPRDENLAKAARILKQNTEITVEVDLGLGSGRAHILSSDLTYDYVKLNAEYHT